MPFAVINTVRIENVDQSREALLGEVVPNVKKAPGFVNGVWAADRDKGRGVGIVVFESREQAEEVVRRLASGELKRPAGVTVEDVAVYEVQAQA